MCTALNAARKVSKETNGIVGGGVTLLDDAFDNAELPIKKVAKKVKDKVDDPKLLGAGLQIMK